MIDLGTAIRHYKREEVQEELIYSAKDKEAVARFGDSFGQRPDILKYPKDILELAQGGATSFHSSEELWSYPLRLQPMMSKTETDELRIGWDLVLDIDCAFVEYSKIAADEIYRKLNNLNISAITVKFSGNKGFHIGVPFESFPETIAGKEARQMFPDAARAVAAYLKDQIKENVSRRLLELENNNISNVISKTGRQLEVHRIKSTDTIEQAQEKISKYIESFLNIDTVLISTRHLYRMPYSLHEKSGLVSIPIEPERIMQFQKEEAKPENIVFNYRFLDRTSAVKNEAHELFDQAYYFSLKDKPVETKESKHEYQYAEPGEAIPQQNWPPCMQKLMEGMEDGRKRGLFILINFLSSTGHQYKEIEAIVNNWNKRNKPPLGEPYVQGQLEYQKQRKKKALPPNCHNDGYYSDMGIKCEETICTRCKNPVVFAKRKMKQ